MTSRRFRGLGRISFPSQARDEIDFIFKEVVRDREYLQRGITLRPGDTVFDVGANVGVFALFVAQECQQEVTLFCFEPIPETYHWLELNLERYQDRNATRITSFNQGLTRLGGKQFAEFTYFPAVPGNSTMFPGEKKEIFQRLSSDRRELLKRLVEHNPLRLPAPWLTYRLLSPFVSRQLEKINSAFSVSEKIRCQLTTITDVCREHSVQRIDLLKVDVEGAELEVLEGMDDKTWQITGQVVLEVHDVDSRVARIETLLESHGLHNISVVKPSWAEALDLNASTIYARR
jgi:FkbM family methyltransferase